MKRYENIAIEKNDGVRNNRITNQYPIIEPELGDNYIVTQQGDRLDNLAWEFYKDPTLWWIIARANGLGKGNFSVPVGIQIRIPMNITDIIDEYNSINK